VWNGLYAIDMPVTDLVDYAGLYADVVIDEISIRIADWEGLRRDVREGQEVMLVGSVPEQEGAVQVVGVVTEFNDEQQVVRVVV
jgi:hypothetical protein